WTGFPPADTASTDATEPVPAPPRAGAPPNSCRTRTIPFVEEMRATTTHERHGHVGHTPDQPGSPVARPSVRGLRPPDAHLPALQRDVRLRPGGVRSGG